MVLRAVWLVALLLNGVVFQKVAQELLLWPIGVLVVALMGWFSKSWGGVQKTCPRIPTLYTTQYEKCNYLALTGGGRGGGEEGSSIS